MLKELKIPDNVKTISYADYSFDEQAKILFEAKDSIKPILKQMIDADNLKKQREGYGMSQELERYKTLCVAQEAEIARLKNGFDELKVSVKHSVVNDNLDSFNKIHNDTLHWVLHEINRITGE